MALAKLLLCAEDCDSLMGDCQGVDHTEGEEENKYTEKLNDLDVATVKNEETDSKEYCITLFISSFVGTALVLSKRKRKVPRSSTPTQNSTPTVISSS